MLNTMFKRMIVLVSFVALASTVVEAASLTGCFTIAGVVRCGTLSGSKITIRDGVATAEPPAKFEGGGGFSMDSPNDPIKIPLSPSNKMVVSSDVSLPSITIESSSEAITISSDDVLNASIYDLSGGLVYSATNAGNIFINGNTFLNFSKGLYTLSFGNDGNEEYILNFVFDGQSFLIK